MTTILIALPIALFLHSLRRPGDALHAWKHATTLERCLIALVFVPIPGPVDDIVAAIVIARVLRRAAA